MWNHYLIPANLELASLTPQVSKEFNINGNIYTALIATFEVLFTKDCAAGRFPIEAASLC
jgi:hypothetical protein